MASTFEAHCPTIECEGCATSIQRTLGHLTGVELVTTDIATKNVRVQFDPTKIGPATMRERLRLAGFFPDLEKVL
ncbi:MAG: Heavy-metal-associated domain [Chthonomonadales bacterium]|nr:Heavy-metal-associated domain [Chthonomonadales bacterium]